MNKKQSITKVEDKEYFEKRLNIISGQIHGLAEMINNNRSYEEVLIQLSALTNSLKTVGRSILENYMNNNLDVKNQKEIKEVINLFNKLV